MLQVTDLTKKYPDFTLDNVSFEIPQGMIVGFIGQNGAGKTTTLKCIMRTVCPDGGKVVAFGKDMAEYESQNKQIISFTTGAFDYYPRESLAKIAKVYASFYDEWSQADFDNYCRRFNLVTSKKVCELSAGMKVKFALSLAMSHNAKLFIFDEPTSALDPGMIGEVQSVIRMLAKSGITMMIVTHEMDFARKISNRVLYMDEGGIYEEGTPKEIFENPKKPNTIKFIKRLTSLTYKIETDDYDFSEAYDELQQYAEKLLIENERISDLQIALEEIVVNNIMESTDHPDVLVRVDYSEKHDILTLTIRYKGDHHDPKDSDNELFLEMLDEPTTELIDRIIQSEDDVYNNFIQLTFKWEEA